MPPCLAAQSTGRRRMLYSVASAPSCNVARPPMADRSCPPFLSTTAPTLVGRERELASLRTGLDAAVGGRGSLILIGGGAGGSRPTTVPARPPPTPTPRAAGPP